MSGPGTQSAPAVRREATPYTRMKTDGKADSYFFASANIREKTFRALPSVIL